MPGDARDAYDAGALTGPHGAFTGPRQNVLLLLFLQHGHSAASLAINLTCTWTGTNQHDRRAIHASSDCVRARKHYCATRRACGQPLGAAPPPKADYSQAKRQLEVGPSDNNILQARLRYPPSRHPPSAICHLPSAMTTPPLNHIAQRCTASPVIAHRALRTNNKAGPRQDLQRRRGYSTLPGGGVVQIASARPITPSSHAPQSSLILPRRACMRPRPATSATKPCGMSTVLYALWSEPLATPTP
jgi:hypothetical protein